MAAKSANFVILHTFPESPMYKYAKTADTEKSQNHDQPTIITCSNGARKVVCKCASLEWVTIASNGISHMSLYTFPIVKSVTTFGAICMHFDGSWVVFEHPVCIWDCPSINLTHGCHGHALVGRSKLARGCIGLHPWSVLESARSVPESAKSLVPAPVFACNSPEGAKWYIRLENQAVHITHRCMPLSVLQASAPPSFHLLR